MTTRYRCPLSTCTWFHETVASTNPAPLPADVMSWSALNWSSMGERINNALTAVQVVDAHLVTHSPVQWMTELRLLQARAEAAEDELDRLRDAQQQTANAIAAVHPITSMRLPSRAEVEATDLWRPAVAVDTGAAVQMPDAPKYATGGLVPGPKPGDPPLFRDFDPCMHGRFLAEAWCQLKDPAWVVTTDPNGTLHLIRSRGKQYEEDADA